MGYLNNNMNRSTIGARQIAGLTDAFATGLLVPLGREELHKASGFV